MEYVSASSCHYVGSWLEDFQTDSTLDFHYNHLMEYVSASSCHYIGSWLEDFQTDSTLDFHYNHLIEKRKQLDACIPWCVSAVMLRMVEPLAALTLQQVFRSHVGLHRHSQATGFGE